MAPPSQSPDDKDAVLTRRPEVKEMIRLFKKGTLALADYHAIGKQLRLLAEDTKVAGRGSRWRVKVANILGRSEATLNKCLQFRLAYKAEELPALQRLDTRWGMVTIVLGIKNRKNRKELLKEANDNKWDEQQLQRAVQQLRGSRRGGGRHRREVKSMGLQPDLSELARLAEVFNVFQENVWSAGQGEYADKLTKLAEGAKETVRKLLEDAAAKLKRLQKGCSEALKVVKALLEKLLPEEGSKS